MVSTIHFCLAKDRAISCPYIVLLVTGQAREVTSQIMYTSIMCMSMTFAQPIRYEN